MSFIPQLFWISFQTKNARLNIVFYPEALLGAPRDDDGDKIIYTVKTLL